MVMAYYKRWRKCNAVVHALAEASSSSNDDQASDVEEAQLGPPNANTNENVGTGFEAVGNDQPHLLGNDENADAEVDFGLNDHILTSESDWEDSESEDTSEDPLLHCRARLSEWAMHADGIPRSQLNKLLDILREAGAVFTKILNSEHTQAF